MLLHAACTDVDKRGEVWVQGKRNVPLGLSGHQTQAGDLSREEGVEDEDNRLRTRVEVQLLEEEDGGGGN